MRTPRDTWKPQHGGWKTLPPYMSVFCVVTVKAWHDGSSLFQIPMCIQDGDTRTRVVQAEAFIKKTLNGTSNAKKHGWAARGSSWHLTWTPLSSQHSQGGTLLLVHLGVFLAGSSDHAISTFLNSEYPLDKWPSGFTLLEIKNFGW